MNLPEELILSIFVYIAITERIKLRAVCKSWAKLLLHPTLLKNLDFSMIAESFRERYLDIALSNSTHVVSLKLFQCDVDGYATLCGKSLTEASRQGKFKTLKKLTVVRTELDDAHLIQILQGTENLEHIDLFDTRQRGYVGKSIVEFASHSLRYLRFPSGTYWNRHEVELVLDNCRTLQTISIERSMWPHDLMRSLLFQRKWCNIKRIVLTVDIDYEQYAFEEYGRVFDDDYVLPLVKDMAATKKPGPILCLCETPVKEDTKIMLKRLNIVLCSCRSS